MVRYFGFRRYACLELLGFVGQLKQTHRRLLCRMDVIKTLLTVLVSVALPLFFFPFWPARLHVLRSLFRQLDLKENPYTFFGVKINEFCTNPAHLDVVFASSPPPVVEISSLQNDRKHC